MLRNMSGEIMFLRPGDVNNALAVLIENDLEGTISDGFDPCGPAVFVTVSGRTRLDADQFFDWLESLMEPVGGELLEAGEDDGTSVRSADTAPSRFTKTH
jgi:hypothetical protein